MSIRLSALLVLSISACGFQSSAIPEADPVLSETSEPIINTCDPVNYPCDPFDRFANGICQSDKAFAPGHLCSPDGDPLWQTHCAPGFLP